MMTLPDTESIGEMLEGKSRQRLTSTNERPNRVDPRSRPKTNAGVLAYSKFRRLTGE